ESARVPLDRSHLHHAGSRGGRRRIAPGALGLPGGVLHRRRNRKSGRDGLSGRPAGATGTKPRSAGGRFGGNQRMWIENRNGNHSFPENPTPGLGKFMETP